MSNFFKDVLDNLIGPPVPNDSSQTVWDKLSTNSETLNLFGVSNISNQPLENRQDGGRRLPSEQLASIIQNRDRAFNRIDINPFLLDSRQYKAQVDPSRLYDLMGYESDNYGGAQGAINTNETPVLGWRTVEIAFAGSFLKFEFLPGLVNTNISSGYDGSVPSNYDKPTYNQLGNVGSNLAGAASNRQVLIQFDDTSGPLLLAKDGDVFKVPFERIYVTFKFYVPRFSIIVGYNAEIVSNEQTKQLNQKPAYGGGYSLWNNEDRHCIPFNFQSQGWNPADYTYANQSAGIGVTNATPIFDLNAPSQTSDSVYGQAVGWITGISLTLYVASANAVLGNFQIGLCPRLVAPFLNSPYIRLLHVIPWTVIGIGYQNINVQFTEPIRFTLNRRRGCPSFAERLVVKLANAASSNADISYNWSVTGYIWGKDFQDSNPSPMEALTSSPYPLDYYD